jgi:hypothetical protein
LGEARKLSEKLSTPGDEIFFEVVLNGLVTEPDCQDRGRQGLVIDCRLVGTRDFRPETDAGTPADDDPGWGGCL